MVDQIPDYEPAHVKQPSLGTASVGTTHVGTAALGRPGGPGLSGRSESYTEQIAAIETTQEALLP